MPSSSDIIRILEANGWEEVRCTGSHHHFKHPNNPNIVTVVHPRKDNPTGYVKSIEKLTGLKLR
ncbi:MAG: type II toxin-antitoxin system HicA family toxin [Caenispirillum bisanense]|nr:type II toxin-antitoxin system HicA family toxin [Caenispirillum bisanense]MCA1972545.1 type II toxin-antitoxin system HicA family toxin [Caenispirillum sp.]